MCAAFRFTLDPTEDQKGALARHFGARRKAYNWAVGALKADIEQWHATRVETAKPSLRVLRMRNRVKDDVCVNAAAGAVWWPECSKEAYADGIAGAVDAHWDWQQSRVGKHAGKRVGFPRFKRKGRDADRVSFTTGAMRVEPDRRHLTLPVTGTVRTHENTRRIRMPHCQGRARVPAISLRRNGTRLDASIRVLVQRPQQPSVAQPGFRMGIDVGLRRLATVADGVAIEQVPPTHDRSTPRCVSCGTFLGHGRAARKARGATVSAPPNYPGCTAGSTMSAPITCTSDNTIG